jgi:hypothetical protein
MNTSTHQSRSGNWIRVVVVALLLPEASPGRAPCTPVPTPGSGASSRMLPSGHAAKIARDFRDLPMRS